LIVANEIEYQQALTHIINTEDKLERYVIQPLLQGDAISLSALFKYGKGVLLSCNQQHIHKIHNQFVLTGCSVNVDNPRRDFYQTLINKVATAMPGLWGYIGIDIIETTNYGPVILEINPRLTTSYVGLGAAIGVNVAARMLDLLAGELEECSPANLTTVNVAIH